jgi:hypothetical protein
MYLPITGTGDGSAPVVPITFEYLATAHVKATVDGSPVDITWTGASEVTFDAAVAVDAEWRVYRETPTDEPLVDFTDGSFLTEDDLDLSQRQLLFRQQEVDISVEENVAAAEAAAEAAAQAEVAALMPQVEADAEAAALAVLSTKADSADLDLAEADIATLEGDVADLDGRLDDTIVLASDFGAVGDNVADDTTELTAFFNSAIANPGVEHRMDGIYRVTAPMPQINVSGVKIVGGGAEQRDGLAGELDGTWIRYVGVASTGSLVTIAPTSGASNRRVTDVTFVGIGLDGNSGVIDKLFTANSILDSDIDIATSNADVSAVNLGVVAALAESRTAQNNKVTLKIRQVEDGSGVGIHMTGDATANWSMNEFWVDAVHSDGPVLLAENVDNNDWRFFRSFKVPAGTAVENITLQGGASEPVTARGERFHMVSANLPAHVYGTEAYAYPSTNVRFHLDTDNGTPEPLLGTDATAFITKNSSDTLDNAWVEYEPIVVPIGGSVTTWGTVLGRYRKQGKRVDVKLTFTTTDIGTATIGFTATAPLAAGGSIANILVGKESAVNNKAIVGLLNAGSSSISIYNFDGTFPGVNGGVFTLSGSYEVA